jgi:hypothetical protein
LSRFGLCARRDRACGKSQVINSRAVSRFAPQGMAPSPCFPCYRARPGRSRLSQREPVCPIAGEHGSGRHSGSLRATCLVSGVHARAVIEDRRVATPKAPFTRVSVQGLNRASATASAHFLMRV